MDDREVLQAMLDGKTIIVKMCENRREKNEKKKN